MNRILARITLGVAAGLLVLGPSPASAQTTFTACRVPDVGAIYMIGVTGAPTACLDASHVEFSWTEGGAPPDGSITTAKLADDAVTSTKIAPSAVDASAIAAGAVGASEIATAAVGTAEIANGAVTAAKINAAVNLGFTNIATRSSTSTSIPAGASVFITATCNAGELAIAGGATNFNASGVLLKQSYPVSSTAWNVTYQNTSVSNANGTAYAICVS